MPFRRRSEPEPDPDADPSVWAPPREEVSSHANGSVANGPSSFPEAPEERSAVLQNPGPPADDIDFDAYQPEVLDGPDGSVADELDPPPEKQPESAAADEPETPMPVAPRAAFPVVTDAEGAVRAAGGVVWTDWGEGGLRVLLVHRPRYDDWSLPKGKAHPGENDRACAVREVREETGLSCSLADELPSTTYLDRHGRVKTVRYWTMQPLGGSLRPDTEVDDARWVPVDEARGLLTYERDVEVVEALVAQLEPPPSEEPLG